MLEDLSRLGGALGTARRMKREDEAKDLERRIAFTKIVTYVHEQLAGGIELTDEEIGTISAMLVGRE